MVLVVPAVVLVVPLVVLVVPLVVLVVLVVPMMVQRCPLERCRSKTYARRHSARATSSKRCA